MSQMMQVLGNTGVRG